jgi:hypothetical protein
MADQDSSDVGDEVSSDKSSNPQQQADYDVGFKRPPRQHQFRKGQPSANPKGRPRGSRKQTINLHKILMQAVLITNGGRRKKVPFPVAHLQRIMEKAAKGDPKADQSLFQLYKMMYLFDPEESSAPFEFTLNIGPPRKTLLGSDAAEPAPARTGSLPGADTTAKLSKGLPERDE